MHQNILFLCVANSARSQMAEGLARAMYPERTILSAGSEPSRVNPFAIAAMEEIGIDITSHTSDSVQEVDPDSVDLVITLCADEVCPVFLSDAPQIHWPFQDPDRKNEDLTDAERLEHFRVIRDKIQTRLRLLGLIAESVAPIFVSTDVDEALARYNRMGFETSPYIESGRTIYGFASFAGIQIHIIRVDEIEPKLTTSAAYLYLRDGVDALHDAWREIPVEGKLHAPNDTPYGLREMAYVDLDGNMLRIGEPLPK